MKKLSVFIALTMLAGCSAAEVVYLKNPTGETVKCGPYHSMTGPQERLALTSLRECVSDYQIQGYHRAPGP